MKYFSKKTITIKDVVELCKDDNGNETVSYQLLSMRKIRDGENFPKEINGYYKTIDMLNYLSKSGIINSEISYHPKNVGSFVIISICGRARTGKDYLAAIFVENPVLYRTLFSASGDDFTQCREIINIADDYDNGIAICSNLAQLYKENNQNDLSDSFYAEALYFKDRNYNLDSMLELFSEDLKRFNTLCKNAREKGISLDGTTITYYTKPSVMTSKILDNINKDWMQINVYPGESGKVKNGVLSKSDLFILLLRSENKEDAQTIVRIAGGIKPYCADAKVLTLFRGEQPIDSIEEYEECEKDCVSSAIRFKEELDNLKHDKGILETDLSIVRLEKNIMMVPPIKKNATNKDIANKIFIDKVEEKISILLKPSDYISNIKEIVSEVGSEAIDYIKSILCNLKIGLNKSGEVASIVGFNRCFSYNYHNLNTYAYDSMNIMREKLYSYFNQNIDANNDWHKTLAVLLYKYLSSQCRDDAGLGVAWQPFEAQPPVCMRTEEAMSATEVLNMLKNKGENGNVYEEALKSVGIESSSWNYVSIKNDNEGKADAIKRLELISLILQDYNSKNYKEAVFIKQIVGSFIYAEYKLLTLVLNYDDKTAIDTIKDILKTAENNNVK